MLLKFQHELPHTIDAVGKGIARGSPRRTPEPEVEQENERPLRSTWSDLIDAASTLGAVDPIGIDPLA